MSTEIVRVRSAEQHACDVFRERHLAIDVVRRVRRWKRVEKPRKR